MRPILFALLISLFMAVFWGSIGYLAVGLTLLKAGFVGFVVFFITMFMMAIANAGKDN